MDVCLRWEIIPDLVVRSIELMGEFDEQGVQYAISEGFRIQRDHETQVLQKEHGSGDVIFQ